MASINDKNLPVFTIYIISNARLINLVKKIISFMKANQTETDIQNVSSTTNDE